MSYPRFPVSLDAPLRDGFSAAIGEGRVRTAPDAGTPRQRRRFSNAAMPVTLTLIVTRQGRAELEAFIAETLDAGSLAFSMPDPSTDGWPLAGDTGAALLTDAGAAMAVAADWLCVFDQLPSFEPAGVEFRARFSILVLPS